MPLKSEAQRRFMAARAFGKPKKGSKGPSREVALEFLRKSKGVKDLPERAPERDKPEARKPEVRSSIEKRKIRRSLPR